MAASDQGAGGTLGLDPGAGDPVLSYAYITRTKQGYEIAVVGESANTARYAGIRVGRVMCRTMFLSGGIAGLVGMLQFVGADETLTEGTAGGWALPPSQWPGFPG